MMLRIHYLNRQGEMAYQDAEFEQDREGPGVLSEEEYENQIARSFGDVGFKSEDDETKCVFWIPAHRVVEVERLRVDEESGLVIR